MSTLAASAISNGVGDLRDCKKTPAIKITKIARAIRDYPRSDFPTLDHMSKVHAQNSNFAPTSGQRTGN